LVLASHHCVTRSNSDLHPIVPEGTPEPAATRGAVSAKTAARAWRAGRQIDEIGGAADKLGGDKSETARPG
jgi:hypothetical protein